MNVRANCFVLGPFVVQLNYPGHKISLVTSIVFWSTYRIAYAALLNDEKIFQALTNIKHLYQKITEQ